VSGSTSAIIINIYAPFWFVNRTGLPLIVKQDGTSYESAGQQPEHEIARSISPLLFSFSEPDCSHSCSLRLGKSRGAHPRWCTNFYLEKGMWFRRLKVGQNDPQKPDKIYELGIDIRNGRDRYRGTRIVTITPRYQIENLSSYRLEFAQKFITTAESEEQENIMSTLPKSNVSFHWPRTDRDKLLCVRIASIPNCFWSGGFAVEPSTSFHLNIRDEYSKSYFIRVEILIQSATYFIVFTDANNLPPPIRVENLSQVPIQFYQTKTVHSWLKTYVRPNTSLAYAWDESTLNPHITVRAPGGSCSTYDMNTLAPGDQLTYDNFIYISFNGTFQDESDDEKVTVGSRWIRDDINRHQLVFDVPEGSKSVFLACKERGKRSQLWRMDNSKRLIHEGSSPPLDPNDPKRSSFHRTDKNALVLDISTQCALPGEYIPLMLRKIDARRALTQTWTFTSDGRLCCGHSNLFVQSRDGLRAGKEVVLGPTRTYKFETMPNGIPIEQAIGTQKMRKGSGVLSVAVLADGPTRVLRISDIKNSANAREKAPTVNNTYWKHEGRDNGFLKTMEFHVLFNIESIGLSVINHLNEELLYLYFRNSIFDFSFNSNEWNLNCSVHNIQVCSKYSFKSLSSMNEFVLICLFSNSFHLNYRLTIN
jgi:vacuolar protein sorting-associated protein 13D